MQISLEEYLEESKIGDVKKWYDALQRHFATCELYWLYMTRLERFDLFISDYGFLTTTRDTYFEMFIIKFYALIAATDRKTKPSGIPDNSLTLPKLLGFLKENAKNDEIRNQFLAYVNQEKFDAWVESIRNRLSLIRNKFTAHIDAGYYIQNNDFGTEPVNTQEIRSWLDETKAYFQKMSFLDYYPFHFMNYDIERKQSDGSLDVDQILDLIAMNSHIVKMPESSPRLWGIRRARLSIQQIGEVNRIRRKMGLPDVE